MKIVISVALAFLLIGCSEESKEEVQKSEPKQVQPQTAPVEVAPVKEVVVSPKDMIMKEVKVASTAPVSAVAPDAKVMFKVCASCHGQNAEKSALGKSKIIKGWNPQEVKLALEGYKDGSYGGAMKSIMKGQASKLSDEQIEALAGYISKL